ncbi:MAG: vancomycin resistance protein, partial [Clostridiales bacterium]|nr:vancomycin resistance protein [Clostridiales bacterium]
LLRHFIQYGMREGRQAKSTFNVSVYKSRYADLRKAFGNDLEQYYLHYIRYGRGEGRTAA